MPAISPEPTRTEPRREPPAATESTPRLRGLGYKELNAILADRARVRDAEFDRLSKLQYWLGHCYLVYWGKLGDQSQEVGKYEPGVGTKLVARALERIRDNIGKRNRQPEEYRPAAEIDRSAITDEQIAKLTKHQVPFVVRGGIRDWEAVKQFTPQFFKDRYGDVQIPINKGEKRPDANKNRPTDYREYYTIRYDTVANLVDSVVSGGALQALSVEDILHRDDDYLLNNFLDIDQIKRWSGYSDPKRSLYQRITHVGQVGSVQLFMASPTGYTTWHCAPADNFFLQVYGSKYWTFADTLYTVGMSPIIKRSQTYQGSRVDAREPYEDCVSRGFELYPYVPKYHTTLNAGDLLFNPEYCWHSVRTAGNEPTIGLGVRTGAQPSLRSPVYQILRFLDRESREMIKSAVKTGRLKDDDLVNRIFEYVDPSNRLRSDKHASNG